MLPLGNAQNCHMTVNLTMNLTDGEQELFIWQNF